MAVKAYNTITLISIDDVNISMTEPDSPVLDQLWLDTSKEPNELMRYDGTSWVRTQHESVEELDPTFSEWIATIGNETASLRVELNTLSTAQTITPPERVNFQHFLSSVKSDSTLLLAKIEGETDEAEALSTAADALIELLNGILLLEDYATIDFNSLEEKYQTYIIAYGTAALLADNLAAEKFTEVEAGNIALGNRIGAYEEQLVLDSDKITMKVMDGTAWQNAMELSKDELSFYSEGEKVSWFAKNQMMIENAVIVSTLQVGNHTVQKHGNEFTIFKYTGE
ncbi:MAG: hypothetical protein M0P29_13095 [Sphaerochaetaceae bacterium]|nr:hypothetical protein [Sphaerochaetaceae bacterium]